MENNLDWALKYASLGWKVFPVKHKTPMIREGFKRASDDRKQIEKWWTRWPKAGIAVATGKVSGLVILDVDSGKAGATESMEALEKEFGKFDRSLVCETGGGGYHLYFKYPDSVRVNSSQKFKGLTGLDIRADGGYAVVPPSAHESGKFYKWAAGKDPLTVLLPATPQVIVDVAKSRHTRHQALKLKSEIPDGERNATLTAVAGLMRSAGMAQEDIEAILLRQNATRCNPPLDEEEVRAIAYYVTSRYPDTPNKEVEQSPSFGLGTLLTFAHTDQGYAELLAMTFSGRVRYNFTRGTWMLWQQHHWERDTTEQIHRYVIDGLNLYKDAIEFITDEEKAAAAASWHRRMQGLARIQSALALVRSTPGIASTAKDWDATEHLLCTLSGVVDLTKGQVRPGAPLDYISLQTKIPVADKADCPRWMQFLDEVFLGDKEVIQFVQKAAGYSLTASSKEQCLFLCVGNGSNGKSVFLSILRTLAGEYGLSAPFSTFEKSYGTPNSNDIASLAGKRFVTASEVNQGKSFDEARIKGLTGGEPMSARFLHQEYFEFIPMCKIWIGVNQLPRVDDDSDGFWRRVRRIDFKAKFSQETRDPDLLTKLEAELPGILKWAIEGAVKWYREGLIIPSSVESATKIYRQEADFLSDYLETCCDEVQGESASVDELYRTYILWCRNRLVKSYEIVSSGRFENRLQAQYPIERVKGIKSVMGLTMSDAAKDLSTQAISIAPAPPKQSSAQSGTPTLRLLKRKDR